MSVGYQDYARLTRAGGTELFHVTGNVNNGQVLFTGHVGDFEYLNLLMNVNTSTDFCRVQIAWYADSSFGTSAGFRFAQRGGGNLAQTQYVNLAPWVQITLFTKSGSPMGFSVFAAYGSHGVGNGFSLASQDVPITSHVGNIAASTSLLVVPIHIVPGNAKFSLLSGAAAWFTNFFYYDWTLNAFTNLWQVSNTQFAKNAQWDVPCLDTPMEIEVHNSDTVAQNFIFSYMGDELWRQHSSGQ